MWYGGIVRLRPVSAFVRGDEDNPVADGVVIVEGRHGDTDGQATVGQRGKDRESRVVAFPFVDDRVIQGQGVRSSSYSIRRKNV